MKPAKGNITIVERIYHRIVGENPIVEDTTFSKELQTDEQVYQRRCRVSETPEPLDLGWFQDKPQDVGYIRITNDEGKFLQVQPTEEEKAETASHMLLLSGFKIEPGDSFRAIPLDVTKLRICSASETTRFTLTVYPR